MKSRAFCAYRALCEWIAALYLGGTTYVEDLGTLGWILEWLECIRGRQRGGTMCIGDKKCEESKVIFCVDDGHNLFLSWPGFVGQRQKLRRNESATRKSHMWRRMFVGKTVGTRLFSWRIMLLYIFIYLYSHSIFQSQRPTRVKMLVRKIFTSHRFTPRIPSSCCPLHDRWSCPLHLAGELVEPIPCAYFPISSVSNPSQDPQFLYFFFATGKEKKTTKTCKTFSCENFPWISSDTKIQLQQNAWEQQSYGHLHDPPPSPGPSLDALRRCLLNTMILCLI